MLKVDINSLFQPILQPINGLLIFPSPGPFFQLLLQLSIRIFQLCIFPQQRRIQLIIDLIQLIDLFFQFFVLWLVMCQLILCLLQLLCFLVVWTKQLLVLLFQLAVWYVGKATCLTSGSRVVAGRGTLLWWPVTFAAVLPVKIYDMQWKLPRIGFVGSIWLKEITWVIVIYEF